VELDAPAPQIPAAWIGVQRSGEEAATVMDDDPDVPAALGERSGQTNRAPFGRAARSEQLNAEVRLAFDEPALRQRLDADGEAVVSLHGVPLRLGRTFSSGPW
jgi:hypothetical protein